VSITSITSRLLLNADNYDSIFGTLGGEADFGPAAYSNAVTKRSLKGKRNVAVKML
jgi:hypothetical protein